jgi:hypothetical protein
MITGNYIEKSVLIVCELWEMLLIFLFLEIRIYKENLLLFEKIPFFFILENYGMLFNFLFLANENYKKYCYYL